MYNHVATIALPRKIVTHPPTNIIVHQIGEDWALTNIATGKVNMHLGQMNAVTCPEADKYQYYTHLLKEVNNKMAQVHYQ